MNKARGDQHHPALTPSSCALTEASSGGTAQPFNSSTVPAAAPSSHTLLTRSLTVTVGARKLVTDLSQSFLPGEMWCLVGPNGAGKTTLLHTLAGMRSPQHGTIELDGRLLSAWPLAALAQRRALMLQARQAVFNMNVFNTVLLARHPYLTGWGWESDEDQAAALAAIEALQLTPLTARLVTSLSGGEQQRVALATALCQQAPLLLLDEPLASLDLAHQIACLHLLREWLSAQPHRTIIFSCHDLNLARHFATHALLLDGTHAIGGPVYDILTPDLISHAFHHPFKLVCDGDQEALMPILHSS